MEVVVELSIFKETYVVVLEMMGQDVDVDKKVDFLSINKKRRYFDDIKSLARLRNVSDVNPMLASQTSRSRCRLLLIDTSCDRFKHLAKNEIFPSLNKILTNTYELFETLITS